tara:strand:- start:765 stop:1925 length:1161 start_codon:yes stop_codon:yes gene_type:complete
MSGSVSPPKMPKGRNTGIGMYIKLARYDVNFINNVSSYIHRGMGMTVRQRELAVNLTGKYRKQFRSIGVDVSKIFESPEFRTSIRTVDRTKRFDIINELIHLYFPYNQDMIKEMNTMLRDGVLIHNSKSEWNADEKRWDINNTEGNFVTLYNWAKKNSFEFSPKSAAYYNELDVILQNPNKYNIYVTAKDDTSLELHNAPKELQEYWDSNIKNKKIIEQVKSCGLLAIDLDISVLTKYNFSKVQQDILSNGFVTLDEPISTVLFNCLDLGFEKIAVGLTSHSVSNIEQVNKIIKWYKVKFDNTDDVVINSKNPVFTDLKVATEPTEKTRLIITDRMSRLQNKHWNFKADVTIGHGMYNKRNIFQGSKIIDVKPTDENWTVDSDELF